MTQLKRLKTKLKYDVKDRDQLCNLTPKTKTKKVKEKFVNNKKLVFVLIQKIEVDKNN